MVLNCRERLEVEVQVERNLHLALRTLFKRTDVFFDVVEGFFRNVLVGCARPATETADVPMSGFARKVDVRLEGLKPFFTDFRTEFRNRLERIYRRHSNKLMVANP